MPENNQHIGKRSTLIIVLTVLVLLIGHELELHLPDLENWVEGMGIFAPLAFIALFVVLSPLMVSADALCFAAGLLFSLGAAEIYVIIATYLAAAVIFFIGRHLLQAKVSAFIKKYQRLAGLDSMLGNNPVKLMLLLRLTPLPFALLSYALSVTRVNFWPYLVSTSGILVYNISLVYFGYATKHFAGLLLKSGQPSHVSYPLLILGLLALLTLLVFVARMAARTLNPLNGNKTK